jgi:hypothetical protein
MHVALKTFAELLPDRSSARSCPLRPHTSLSSPSARGPPLRAACSTAPVPADTEHLGRIRHVIAPRRLADEDLVVHEVDSVHMRLRQCGKLPHHACTHEDLASHALLLTDLMATGSVFRTLQILKRCPDLLLMEPYQASTSSSSRLSAVIASFSLCQASL